MNQDLVVETPFGGQQFYAGITIFADDVASKHTVSDFDNMKAKMEESRKALDEQLSKIFEASIICPHIPKGSTVNDLKGLLQSYANEFYAEARGEAANANRSAQLHFYKLQRAKDAYKELKDGVHPFGGVDFVSYRKEIGTSGMPIGLGGFGDQAHGGRRAAAEEDEDGFTIVR